MNQSFRVLVVEDEADQRALVVEILKASHYQVEQADGVEAAIVMLKTKTFDVVFSDWKLGELSGLDLLNFVRKNYPDIGMIIATAYGTISHAVEALKQGADDYLSKPFQRQELLLTIEKALKTKLLRSKNTALTKQLAEQDNLVGLVGKAPVMQQVYKRIERVSNTNATVLILGESGTGKELAARALHTMSDRASEPFIAINCGSIAESIAEAELFGAEKGAYTGANATKIGKFEAAHGGTVFLDEIGELPLTLQTNLLRFLQEGSISRLGSTDEISLDVRIIAATHRDLSADVDSGAFREDLFYRLNIVPIEMPALREREQDIIELAEYFLNLHSKRHNVEALSLSPKVKRTLLDYHWPGNVRELSNRIERYVLLEDEQELIAGLHITPVSDDRQFPHINMSDAGFCWESFERYCLAKAVEINHGNKTKAAKYLNLPYKAFLYRLDKYQI